MQPDGTLKEVNRTSNYFYSITLSHATDECGGKGEPDKIIPVKIVSADPEQPLNYLISPIDSSAVSDVDSVV